MESHDAQPLPAVADPDIPDVEQEVDTNGSGDDAAIIGRLKQHQRDLQPFGKTKILPVPGYGGLLGIEYSYIGSEVAEEIGKRVMKETKDVNGRGQTLLSSIDTLIAACKQVVVREVPNGPWQPMDKHRAQKLDNRLAFKLDYQADGEREAVIGLFGSEHAITQQNVMLSRWLADVTRDVEEDFLGM